jgi:hypothetical protein
MRTLCRVILTLWPNIRRIVSELKTKPSPHGCRGQIRILDHVHPVNYYLQIILSDK